MKTLSIDAKYKSKIYFKIAKLPISVASGVVLQPISAIIRLEADGANTHIYVSDGNHYLTNKLLGSYIEMLPKHSFVRIHNKHVVNVTCIHKILLNKHWSIQLLNKDILNVSDEKRKTLLNAMGLVYEETKPDAIME